MKKVIIMTTLLLTTLIFIFVPNLRWDCKDEIAKEQRVDTLQNVESIKVLDTCHITKGYREIDFPTPNIAPDKVNTVEGVILHHTAEPTIERSLKVLTFSDRHVGTHCVIDTDGTRYIMCKPEVVTYHAGFSVLNGRVGCNNFTIGIEFQGNTLEKPLTEDQINSAIEYLLPIMSKYDIPLKNVVSHKMVRDAYMKKFPHKKCSGKVDITDTEYNRFIKELKAAFESKNLQ